MINKLYSVSSYASCYELEFNNARALVIVKKKLIKKNTELLKKIIKNNARAFVHFPLK
jgi:hypothetical protein